MEPTPFDPHTLVIAPAHIHALATDRDAEVLAWDHTAPGGELRAMTNRAALDAGYERVTNMGTLNDWAGKDDWKADLSDVTPEFAAHYADTLTQWLRRIADSDGYPRPNGQVTA